MLLTPVTTFLGLAYALFSSPFSHQPSSSSSSPHISRSSLDRAHEILKHHPILDGHIDLPIAARFKAGLDLDKVDYDGKLWGQVDIPRLRKGQVGGFFSIAYTGCNATLEGPDWSGATNEVRDTLEAIDLTHQLAAYFPDDVAIARSPKEFRENWKHGKVSHWIGIEGGHSLGSSLATLRMFADLGVRYLTLTHYCHNAFADSCSPIEPRHGGLSEFGQRLIVELNRLGVAVDLSHTSDDTQRQAIAQSIAPVIYSHSGAKGIHDHPRNIADDVLHSLKHKEVVIGVPFVSDFVNGVGNSTLDGVVAHIEYIANIVGRHKVAMGSDYDGSPEFAKGLEDVSTYPILMAKMLDRGWSEKEVAGLSSENFLRVLGAIQDVGREMQRGKRHSGPALPDMRPWKGRKDCEYLASPSAEGMRLKLTSALLHFSVPQN